MGAQLPRVCDWASDYAHNFDNHPRDKDDDDTVYHKEEPVLRVIEIDDVQHHAPASH